jgi:two-component sensor histidine kinase
MIDHSSLHALLLQAATGTVESSQAVSLGFVTTELVINALKHAFPPESRGGDRREIRCRRYPTTALGGVTTAKQAAARA